MEVLCIIPARSGSKGIKNKNIIDFEGKPLIAYTIEDSLKSYFINSVVVITDSLVYAKVAELYGAEVPFLREKELSIGNIHAVYPVIDCILKLENINSYIPDIIVMLLPTSPLRKVFHIDEAMELFLSKNEKNASIISVVESNKHPRYLKRIIDGYLVPYEKSNKIQFSKAGSGEGLRRNGSIFIMKRNDLIQTKTFHSESVYPYIMEREYSVDINDKWI